MVLHNLNFDPFYSRTVGFERIFDRLSRIAEENMPSQSSYPPYNIHRKGDDKFDIEIAVAGFSEEDLDIEYKDNELTIEGKKKEDENNLSIDINYVTEQNIWGDLLLSMLPFVIIIGKLL